jgi:hypothetical protein
VVRDVTNGERNVTFAGLKSGRYLAVLLDTSKLKAPTTIVTIGGAVAGMQTSQPILPGKGDGPAYALDESGPKMMVEVGKRMLDDQGGMFGTARRRPRPVPVTAEDFIKGTAIGALPSSTVAL